MEKRPIARRLMTHPGVGVLAALAFELVIGTPERFGCGKQIARYVGLVPTEESSGDRGLAANTINQQLAAVRRPRPRSGRLRFAESPVSRRH